MTRALSFGELLRRHRAAAELTQEALAARAHMSARSVSDLERGVRAAPAQRRRTLQRTGGVPFFLVSCAQALRSGALLGDTDEGVPWDVAQGLRQRIAVLPELIATRPASI